MRVSRRGSALLFWGGWGLIQAQLRLTRIHAELKYLDKTLAHLAIFFVNGGSKRRLSHPCRHDFSGLVQQSLFLSCYKVNFYSNGNALGSRRALHHDTPRIPFKKQCCVGIVHFVPLFSTTSAAASMRLVCGSRRRPLVDRIHRIPAATPHVGQATEDVCLTVSCFTFISRLCCSRFLHGHRAIVQKLHDPCAIYLQAPVVADQALPLKLVHEFTYSRAGGTDHLR